MPRTRLAVRAEQVALVGLEAGGEGFAFGDAQVAVDAEGNHILQALEGEVEQVVLAQALGDGDLAVEGEVGLGRGDEVLGADAEGERVAGADVAAVHRQGQWVAAGQFDGDHLGAGGDGAHLDEVHLRRAEEAGDEAVLRVVIKVQRLADLGDLAGVEYDDLVGQGHGFDLVVGHVDHGGADALMQTGDLDAHLHAKEGVEVRQRFVEEEDLRLADHGAADGDALALAAGEVLGFALEQLVELQDRRGRVDTALDLLFVDVGELEAEGHVLRHRHVRVERVGLEHHAHRTVLGRQVVDALVADVQIARGDVLQPGDQSQQRGLAAAGWTDEDDELTVLDIQVDMPGDRRTVVTLADVAQRDTGHRCCSP